MSDERLATPMSERVSGGRVVAPRPSRSDVLRLACVVDDLGTGGAQRIVSIMARELPRHGIEPVIVSLGTRDAERKALEARGIEVHVLPAASLASPGRLSSLFRLLRTLDPDLVHTHLLASHILGGLVGRALRVPVIATLHNVDPHPRFEGTWKRVAETLCLRFAASHLIAVGPSVRASNARRLGGRRIEMLANPLSIPQGEGKHEGGATHLRDEARARVSQLIGSTADTCHFLTIGRLSTEKGWPGFLDVFDELRRSRPDCRLISVGDGPLLETLRREIVARGLGEHVHLLGRRDDVRTFCLGSDVFVLNSIIEGLPMAVLEAMVSGLPVVSTQVGDVAYAAERDIATLVPPGHVDAMVEALRDAHDRRAEMAARGLEGRRRVLERFEVGRWTGALVARYRELYRESARRRGRRAIEPGADTPPPLHVVEFVDGLKTGGAQSLLALRARHARRMGYRIDVVCLGTERIVPDELAKHVDGIHHFPSPHVFEARRIVRICALLRRLRPDVVHTHLRTSNIVGALCGRLCRVPVVTTLHNTFPELGLAHARRDWAERWALRLGAGRVVAVGPAVAKTHQPRLGRKRIETIPNPVELPEDGREPSLRKAAARASLDLPFDPADARIVITVGRLTRAKGLLDVVQAIARLESASPRIRLLIVGDGDLHGELERCIEAYGLQRTVFLLGRSERVRELMAASDVFVLGSHAEGLPLVLLEAMSMHLPVVATRVGDVPWLLGEGRFGELVDPGDVPGTARAVSGLLDAPESARTVAAHAYDRARHDFSLERWLHEVDLTLRWPTAGASAGSEPSEFALSPDFGTEDADDPRDPVTRLE